MLSKQMGGLMSAIDIIAKTPIVTDAGGVEPLGVANAATIAEGLRTAGYEIVPRATEAPKTGQGFIIGGVKPQG